MDKELKRAGKKDIIEGGSNVLIRGNRCFRCGHEWRPRNMEVPSRVCPACKSPYWDRPRKKRRI